MNLSKPSENSYAVKVKNGGGWRNYDIARLQISVGQEYHEGEKFAATIEWTRTRFKKVIVCVNDTLQRHNLRFEKGAPDSIALEQTKKAGDAWVQRNLPVIETLPNFEIHRWEDWRKHPDYEAQLNALHELYETMPEIPELIAQDVASFWERRCKRLGVTEDYRLPAFKKHATDYLLEETAVFFLMFAKDIAVDVYPGSVLLPCVLGQKYCPHVSPGNLGSKAFTRIEFMTLPREEKTANVSAGGK